MISPEGFGICIPHQNAESDPGYYNHALEVLEPPCWYNYLNDQNDNDYFRMLWKASQVDRYEDRILTTPDDGKIWFLGNEPESEYQSNDTPEEFAQAVDFWRTRIGRPFAVPGILWGTYGYEWWKHYESLAPPESDVYHIHIYAIDGEDWSRLLDSALGVFNDKPLIVTESGGWYLPPKEQVEIQKHIHTAIALRRVPAAFWFSAHYGSFKSYWEPTDCLDENGLITEVGNGYKKWSSAESYETYIPVVRV